MSKTTVQNVVAYTIAAAIVVYAARGVSWIQVAEAGNRATLWLFLVASIGGFLCWFFGETFLYSRLFSYFHAPTGVRELLSTMAAVYFLQIVNSYVAGGAFLVFLHARKSSPWIRAACTLMFQGYVDAMLLATLTLFAIAIVPTSPIRPGLIYAAVVLGVSLVIASFFLFWGMLLPAGNWLRWIYDRPSMSSFRMARPSQYGTLIAVRLVMICAAGVALYGQFSSFHIAVPFLQILAMTPLIIAIGNSPISPGGIGTTQLLFTLAFARFAGRDDLFALSMAVTAFNLLIRIPMGLAMGPPLAENVVELKSELATRMMVDG